MDGACEFRHRMLELLNEEEPPNPGAVLVGAGRCWSVGARKEAVPLVAQRHGAPFG